jgi:hypothetical protein
LHDFEEVKKRLKDRDLVSSQERCQHFSQRTDTESFIDWFLFDGTSLTASGI